MNYIGTSRSVERICASVTDKRYFRRSDPMGAERVDIGDHIADQCARGNQPGIHGICIAGQNIGPFCAAVGGYLPVMFQQQGSRHVGVGQSAAYSDCSALHPGLIGTRRNVQVDRTHGNIIGISDCHRNRLVAGQRAVGDLHDDIIDVVGSHICRGLEVWRCLEAQRARAGIDLEQDSVITARDAVGQRGARVGIGSSDRGDGGLVLGDAQARARFPSVAGDQRRFVVDISDCDRKRVSLSQRAV